MKNFLLLGLCVISFSFQASALCDEPDIKKIGKVVASQSFEVKKQSAQTEMVLNLDAITENASWLVKEAESAVLTIFVDEKYNQDVMLFAGREKFKYKILLGKFKPGKHSIKVVLNDTRSAKNARNVKVFALDVKPVEAKSSEDIFAIANAPFLYARPDTVDKFSDVPLVTYYEILPSSENDFKVRYSTIFTNEDGGTQTAALMARWGRATDIEWVYEIEIKNSFVKSEIIQGANHVTKKFIGEYVFGNHPLIYDVTVNNNFADTGCSALRTALAPVRVDLSKKSRESVMDENPWTYRIMAEEANREGRVNPLQMGANVIDDLRNYLYVEVYAENKGAAAVAVEVKTPDGKTSRSDFGDARLRVDRSGYQRIAVRLPSAGSQPESISLICHAIPQAQDPVGCQNARIIKFIRLNEKYELVNTVNSKTESLQLKADDKLSWQLVK